MFSLLRSLPRQQLFLKQLPLFVISLSIAEAFFKFHSFTLECVAFLLTWFALDYIATFIMRRMVRNSEHTHVNGLS